MTPDQEKAAQDRDRSLEQNRQDLEDIATLKRTEAFERYFLRRIRQKSKQIEEDVLRGKSDHVVRENRRNQLLILDEILAMMKTDEAASKRTLIEAGAQLRGVGAV